MSLRTVSLDQLTIDDEQSVGQVPPYPRLKQALLDSGHRFCLPPEGETASWDRVVFLNLTYWTETGVDVLCDDHIAADVVASATNPLLQLPEELSRQRSAPRHGRHVRGALRSE
jgi:hypothetical protein